MWLLILSVQEKKWTYKAMLQLEQTILFPFLCHYVGGL